MGISEGTPPISFRNQRRNLGHTQSIVGISAGILDTHKQFEESEKEFQTPPINFRNQRRDSGHPIPIDWKNEGINFGNPRSILEIIEGIADTPNQFRNQRRNFGHRRSILGVSQGCCCCCGSCCSCCCCCCQSAAAAPAFAAAAAGSSLSHGHLLICVPSSAVPELIDLPHSGRHLPPPTRTHIDA